MTENRDKWSSNIGFLLAAVGSAVGLGNIWRFPYMMGKDGGALFLIIYLFFIFFITSFALISEISLGKHVRKNCVDAFKYANPRLGWAGWMMFASAVLIPSFYFVVGGWIIYYFFASFSASPADFGKAFTDMTSRPLLPLALSSVFLLSCAYFNFKGVSNGIEKANRIMMPALFLIMIILAVFSVMTLPGTREALKFMFMPDFSKFSSGVLLDALGQSFFTLSVGIGSLMIYGSYMESEHKIRNNAVSIIVFDTIAALLAGIIIFPGVFSYGFEPQGGPGLVFVTLPAIFAKMPGGSLFSAAFFLLLFFSALTSGISLLEPASVIVSEKFSVSRRKAVLIVSGLILLLSVPCSLSFGAMKDFHIFGKTVFDLFDYITSNIFMPLSSFFVCIALGWFLHKEDKFSFGNRAFDKVFNIMTKYVLPVILLIVLSAGLSGKL